MKKCVCCQLIKGLGCFLSREDRPNGVYAFCDDCMIEQVRKPGWPAKSKRGGGLLWWDLDN